jgi:hypothetical protein
MNLYQHQIIIHMYMVVKMDPIFPQIVQIEEVESKKKKIFVNILLIILGNHSNEYHGLSTHSSSRHHGPPSDGVRHSFSSIASGGGGGNGRHPNNNYNKETQRAILTALTKLQRDVNNILERLNRLETSSHFLQHV